MKNLFNKIVDIEERAKKIREDAKAKAQEIENRLKNPEQYGKEYYDEAEKRIAKIEADENAKKAEKFREIDLRVKADLDKFDREYAGKGDKWVDALYSNIVSPDKS